MNLHPQSRAGDEVSYKGRTWKVALRIRSEPQPRRTMLVLADGECHAAVWIENGRMENG